MNINRFVITLPLLISCSVFADDKDFIRLGVQATGTVDWEISALKDQPKQDLKVDVHHLATAEAAKIALQSGDVDMIVTDWVWVSNQRAKGTDFTFYPYSNTSGALVVPEDSPIHTIKDLRGKRLGIVGGELDKNWLLLQALANREHIDLSATVTKTFGAPPLINEQIKQGRVDAVLTYWHFSAQLEAEGYRQVLDGKDILQGLTINESVPTVGYVFRESWALGHKDMVNHFLLATQQAKNQLCTSDEAWQKVIPLTHAEDTPTQKKLRQRYCEGKIEQWDKPQQQAADQIYSMLRDLSNKQLTGQSEHLQPGTFWNIK